MELELGKSLSCSFILYADCIEFSANFFGDMDSPSALVLAILVMVILLEKWCGFMIMEIIKIKV